MGTLVAGEGLCGQCEKPLPYPNWLRFTSHDATVTTVRWLTQRHQFLCSHLNAQ